MYIKMAKRLLLETDKRLLWKTCLEHGLQRHVIGTEAQGSD